MLNYQRVPIAVSITEKFRLEGLLHFIRVEGWRAGMSKKQLHETSMYTI